jgi:hypothetical protein
MEKEIGDCCKAESAVRYLAHILGTIFVTGYVYTIVSGKLVFCERGDLI